MRNHRSLRYWIFWQTHISPTTRRIWVGVWVKIQAQEKTYITNPFVVEILKFLEIPSAVDTSNTFWNLDQQPSTYAMYIVLGYFNFTLGQNITPFRSFGHKSREIPTIGSISNNSNIFLSIYHWSKNCIKIHHSLEKRTSWGPCFEASSPYSAVSTDDSVVSLLQALLGNWINPWKDDGSILPLFLQDFYWTMMFFWGGCSDVVHVYRVI